MKVKVSSLTGQALDWAVSQAEGNVKLQYDSREGLVISNILGWIPYRPSVAWVQGGPIIERERITISTNCPQGWVARLASGVSGVVTRSATGPTPLVAAMRCYVASKLGEEINIPEEIGNEG